MNPHTHSFAMVEVVNKTITSQFLKQPSQTKMNVTQKLLLTNWY